jgi:hypothetical protein
LLLALRQTGFVDVVVQQFGVSNLYVPQCMKKSVVSVISCCRVLWSRC